MTLRCHVRVRRPRFQLHADIQLDDPSFVALFGPSGSGKTTLLRCIAGLERAGEAEVRLGDRVWQSSSTFVPPHRRSIGYVFQEASLFPHLSVRGNLEFGLRRVHHERRRFELGDVARLMGIADMLERRPPTLSGGERQRVAVARALLTSPELLLFDEPMASLDVASRAQLLPYLSAVHRKLEIPVLYVTHSPAEVVRLAETVVYLMAGKVVAQGPLNDILTDPKLPLSRFEEAGGVLEARVVGHEPGFHLTQLALGDARFAVSQRETPVGGRVRVHVRARDVSVSLAPTSQTSAQNVVAARVLSVHEESCPAHRLVRLEVADHVLLARLTMKAASELGLREGLFVYAHVKSVALAE